MNCGYYPWLIFDYNGIIDMIKYYYWSIIDLLLNIIDIKYCQYYQIKITHILVLSASFSRVTSSFLAASNNVIPWWS